MMMNLVKVISNALVLFFAFSIPHYLGPNIDLSWNMQFLLFNLGIFSFISGWCIGLWTPIRWTIILSLITRFFLPYDLTTITLSNFSHLLAGLDMRATLSKAFGLCAVYAVTCTSKSVAESINNAKGVFFDWFFLIILFPITALTDLLLRTDLFFSVISYFFGSNFYGLGIVKGGEFLWQQYTQHEEGRQSHGDEKQQMQFLNFVQVSRASWKKVSFTQLVICFSILFYFLWERMLENAETMRWQVIFSLGAYTTLVAYFGLIATGKPLTEEEIERLSDASN